MRFLSYIALFAGGLLVGLGLHKFIFSNKEVSADSPLSVQVPAEGNGSGLSITQAGEVFSRMEADPSISNTIRALQVMEGISPEDIPGLMEKLMKDPENQMIPFLLRSYTSADPRAALAFVLAMDEGMDRARYLSTVFQTWLHFDREAAMEAARALESYEDRSMVMGMLQNRMDADQPMEAFARLQASPNGGNPREYGRLFAIWARSDPDAAMQALHSIADQSARMTALSSLVGSVFMRNPDRAVELVMGLPQGNEKTRAIEMVAAKWVDKDLDGALAFCESLPPDVLQNLSHSFLLYRASEKDPERMLQWVDITFTGEKHAEALGTVLRQLTNQSPRRAAEVVAGLPFGQDYSSAVMAVSHSWARKDPLGAWEWARELPVGNERNLAFRQISRQMAEQDLAQAENMVLQLEDPDQQSILLGEVARTMANRDPQEALSWAGSLPQDVRTDGYTSVLEEWSQRDPANAAAFYANSDFLDSSPQLGAFLAANWVSVDPVAAVDWVASLPESDTRQSALRRATSQWLMNDSYRASEWIAGLPEGELREGAVSTLVFYLRQQQDFASGMEWALELKNEAGRTGITEGLLRDWSRSDPRAAAQAVLDSGLPGAQQEALLKLIEGTEDHGN